MLTHIDIRDFAIIERAVIEPGRGLLILTGETGAGKSILIDAISALTGARVAKDLVRHGAASASVEALFEVPHSLLPATLTESLGIFAEADLVGSSGGDSHDTLELVLSREMTAAGKSICRINGRLAPLSALRDLAGYLVDIHGQHDQQAIFKVDSHIQMLDRYAGDPVAAARADYCSILQRYRSCIRDMDRLGRDPAERARQIDLLSYQVQEIENAAVKPDEDVKLANRRRMLANREKILESLSDAYGRLAGDPPEGLLAGLGQVQASLESAARHTRDLDPVIESVREAVESLHAASSGLRDSLDTIESDPAALDAVDERLDILYRLKKKYGGTLEAVTAFGREARDRLDALNGGEARYEWLQKEKKRLAGDLVEAAKHLGHERRQAALRLEQLIASELAGLGMKGVRFQVDFAPYPDEPANFPDDGLDRVAFLLAANPGEPPRPLASIASGGEASRIMLAIKTILAKADQIPVLIFDEIDTGVSGQTAARVGEKLHELSRGRQVFCITHMAQIAAMADEHWLIEKHVEANRTHTRLALLDDAQRESELARLLSGGIAGDTARQLARQLISQSEDWRKSVHPD